MKPICTQFPPVKLFLFSLTILAFNSCKKTENDPDLTKGFVAKIQTIVPVTIIDDLRSRGMTINEGQLPPKLQGAFFITPYELVSPTGPSDTWQKGQIIDDFKYQFYDQTDAGDIKLDYTNVTNYGSDAGKGQGAIIGGHGNLFTVFAETNGVSKNIPYTHLVVVTGEITSTGIKNFQYALIMKSKTDDTDNKLIGIGKGRIWKDGDNISERTSGFRFAAPSNTKEGRDMSSTK